jgi:hypothetical protein
MVGKTIFLTMLKRMSNLGKTFCFFMRNDLGQDYFPEISVESCDDNPYTKFRWEQVKNLD